jgi:YgiT-type zinc finger domain-containing protein
MKCSLCKGNIVDGFTTYMVDLDSCIVIVKKVPCHECAQCGEASFTLDVAERLEQIVDSLKDSATEVAIVKYTDTAA